MSFLALRHQGLELSTLGTNAPKDQDPSLLSYEHDDNDDDDHDPESHLLRGRTPSPGAKANIPSRWRSLPAGWLRRHYRNRRTRLRTKHLARACSCTPRSFARTFALVCYTFITTILVAVVVGGVFFPGYTHLPPHYKILKRQVQDSDTPGRANLGNQKVFIAGSIFDKDGQLFRGKWAENVLELIQILGPKNTFLSIYVNDCGPESKKALHEMQQRLPCDHDLVFEDHLDWDKLPHMTMPDGSRRVKRIEYLAEVRNRALRPLETSNTTFDKLLYLNDVFFHPIDAAQLLFSTHTVEGKSDYRAACAVDFINAFKFYDTYATRDARGFTMGIPFFPWFTANGDEQSHQDVLDGKDAVHVRSCWGGMVAFDARFFQKQDVGQEELITAGNQSPSNLSTPYRFRAEKESFWDASECCLIHADIQSLEPRNSGIYLNPFVRVAYDSKTLSWLAFTRRFERLYTPVHFLLDMATGNPSYNPRKDEQPWHEVEELIWFSDQTSINGGYFQEVRRTASHSGFCGRRGLAVMKENILEGEENWEGVPIPM